LSAKNAKCAKEYDQFASFASFASFADRLFSMALEPPGSLGIDGRVGAGASPRRAIPERIR
jgi:hypothetical protein